MLPAVADTGKQPQTGREFVRVLPFNEVITVQSRFNQDLQLPTRKNQYCALLLVLIAMASFAAAQKVETEIDSRYDFAHLKTFALTPLSPKDALNKNPQVVQELKKDLITELQKAGYRENEAHPDFLVSYTADQQIYTGTYTTSQTGVTAENQVWTNEYATRTFTLDFVDPKTNKPFWHATATEKYGLGSMEKFVPKAVKKVVEDFHKDAAKRRKG
jgi:Domain of unknown function (DUF4136)